MAVTVIGGISAVIGAAGAAGALTGFGAFFAYLGTSAAFTAFAVGAGLSLVSRALAPKPSFGEQLRGITQTTRDPAGSRKLVYGKMRVGGQVVFISHSGDDNKYLNMAVAFASHEIESYEELWFNDKRIWTSSGGFVSDWGTYVTIDRKFGTDTQAASTQLVDSNVRWTSDHKLLGIAYIAFKLEWSQDKFPQGVPNITAVVKGKKVYDPRDSNQSATNSSTWTFSQNPALCLRDYLVDEKYGLGENRLLIDSTSLTNAANLCDETQESNVDIYSNGAKRYVLNGVLDTANNIKDNIEQMLSAMGGRFTFSGGKYFIDGAEYRTPAVTLDESVTISEIQVQTKQSRRGIYNGVKGIFVSEEKNYKVLDYPAQVSSTYVTEDGGSVYDDPIYLDMPLPFVTSNLQAQLLAKLVLLKSRQQTTLTMTVNLTGLKLKVGDTVMVTNSRLGYSSKVFEVIDYTLVNTPGGEIGVQLTLIETAASLYDWTSSDEEDFLSGAELPLYDGRTVDNVTALGHTVIGLKGPDGKNVTNVDFTWTAPTDAFVEFYVVTLEKDDDGNVYEYQTRQPRLRVPNLDIGSAYEVIVKAQNLIGVRSSGTTLNIASLEGDTTAPAKPTSFSATGGVRQITVNWTEPADEDFQIVWVYVADTDDISGATKHKSRSEEFVYTLPSGEIGAVTRYFWLSSQDYTGNESDTTASFTGTSVQAFIDDLNIEAGELEGAASLAMTSTGSTAYGLEVNGTQVQWTTVAGTYSWSHKLISDNAFINGAQVSFRITDNTSRYMIGLSDESSGNSYTVIDYAFFNRGSNDDIQVYESGTSRGTVKAVSTGDELCQIIYDGTKVRYLIDGTVVRTVDVATRLNNPIYLHIAVDDGHAAGTYTIKDIAFTQYTSTVVSIEDNVTITGGGITLSNGGAIKGGQTEYDDDDEAGFFLGYDTNAYKFSIGNSDNSKKLTFDGTDLLVTGAIQGGSIQSNNTDPIPADVFTRDSNQNIPTGDESGAFIDLASGSFLFGDADSFVSFAENADETAFELDIKGVLAPTTLDFSAVTDPTVMPSNIKAQGYVDASIGVDAISDAVWNEIDARVGQGSGGFYASATDNYLGAASQYITIGTTQDHGTEDITVKVVVSDTFAYPRTFYVGSDQLKIQLTLEYKVASGSTWVTAGSTQTRTLTPTVFQYATRYTIDESYSVTLTSGTGNDIADGTDYDFRVKLERVGSQSAFADYNNGGANDTTGTPVVLEVSENASGVAATGGNADTLDNIDSTGFLRLGTSSSTIDNTAYGNLTITGNLTVQGTQTTLDTATLQVQDKNIVLNYGTGDTSGSANGAGITIQDGVDSSNDATILWDATNDEFDFSHGASFSGTVTWSGGGSANANTAYTYSQVGHLPLAGGTVTGNVTISGSSIEPLTIGSTSARKYIKLVSSQWPEIRFFNADHELQRIGFAHENSSTYGLDEGDFYIYDVSSDQMRFRVPKDGASFVRDEQYTVVDTGNLSTTLSGYLTAESDTLATVTGRGATTTSAISTGAITTSGDLTLSTSGKKIVLPANHVIQRLFQMDAADANGTAYVLLCEYAGNNDVNGTITMDRTSGLRHASRVDILISSGSSLAPRGTIRSMGVAGNGAPTYSLVKGTHTDNKVYIALKIVNPDNYYESSGAYFTGRISTTVSSNEFAVVTTLTSITAFDENGSHQVGHLGVDGASSSTYPLYVHGDIAQGSGSIYSFGDFIMGNGGLKKGATTIIDASRNLSNITTISSGAITSSGKLKINQAGNGTSNTESPVAALSGQSSSGGTVNALSLVNSITAANSNGVALAFHTASNYSPTGRIVTKQESSGTVTDSRMIFQIYRGGLQDAVIIDHDENMTVGGTISSGAITSSGDVTLNGKLSIEHDGSTTGDVLSLFSNRFNQTSMYGFGLQSGTLYYKANARHQFYSGSNYDNASYDVQFDGSSFVIRTGDLKMGASTFVDASRNITAGTISSGAITSSGNITISRTVPVLVVNDSDATNNTNQIGYVSFQRQGTETGYVGYGSSGNSSFYVAGGNDVILRSAGVNTVTISNTAATFAKFINLSSGADLRVNSNIVLTSDRKLTNSVSFDPSIEYADGLDGGSLNTVEAIYTTAGDADPLNGGLQFNVAGFKTVIMYTRSGSTWTNQGSKPSLTDGNASHHWSGVGIAHGTDEVILYFGSEFGYAFCSLVTMTHETRGNSMRIYLESSESGGATDTGWSEIYDAGYQSSWPGSTTIKKQFGIGAGFNNLFRIRLVPNWAHASNSINLGQIVVRAGYGTVSRLFEWDSAKRVKLLGPLRMNGTDVMDTSRNMSNLGTITASGLITTSNSLHLGSGYNLSWGGAYGDGKPTISANSNTIYFYPTGDVSGQRLYLNATGLVNAGTLTSGAITSSGKIYGGGSSVSTGYTGIFGERQVGASDGNKLLYFFVSGSTLKIDAYDYGTSSALDFTLGGNGGDVSIASSADLKMGTTTVIDSSRNITAGTLTGQTGTFTGQNGTALNVNSGTTNVAAKFESTDNEVWINLKDNNSGNYGALLGHADDALFKVADNSVNVRMLLSAAGLLDTDGGYSVGTTTVIDSSRNLTNIGTISSGAITSSGMGQFQSGAGGIGLQLDTSTSYSSGTLYAPGIRWREADGTRIAGVRGYVNSSGNHLALGTGWLDEEFHIDSSGVRVIGTIESDTVYAPSLVSEGSNSNYGVLRITNPDGAESYSRTSSTVGAIKITLPVSWTSTMMRMTIQVYEYSNDESFTIYCGGYNYGSGSAWVNTFAQIISSGNKNRDYTVRFAHDGTKCCIFIGELNTTWSYPQVAVTDFQAGFNAATTANWGSGWDITHETSSFGTVSVSETNTDIGIHHSSISVGGNEVIDSSRNAYPYQVRASGGDDTPAGTQFSNVIKAQGTNRTIYFDGYNASVSTWYGVGNNPYAAIDCTDGVLDVWVNASDGVWRNVADFATGGFNVTYGGMKIGGSSVFNASRDLFARQAIFAHTDHNYVKIENTSVAKEQMIRFRNSQSNYWYAGIRTSAGIASTADFHIYSAALSGDAFAINTSGDVLAKRNFQAGNGTATLPAFSFRGDPNTGMFSGGADVLKFTTGGTNGLTINATDVVLLRDNVYVKDYLRHYGDTNTYFRFTTDRIRMVAGGVTYIDAVEGATDYLRFPTRAVVVGNNTSPLGAMTIEHDSTDTPAAGGDSTTFLRFDNSNTTASASTVIAFNANDAGGNSRHGAGIQFKKSSNWANGSGSYPGELYFWTRPSSGNQVAAQKLDKDGNAIFKGNVTAYGSLSDRRLKQNIENISDAVNKVQDLNGVTFEYKKDGNRATGLIAQDLEKVLPEAVYTSSDIETGEEHKAIHYGNVVGLLVEAIKELKQEIEDLKNGDNKDD